MRKGWESIGKVGVRVFKKEPSGEGSGLVKALGLKSIGNKRPALVPQRSTEQVGSLYFVQDHSRPMYNAKANHV